MEPKFQSSFIPKTSSQETAVPKEVETAPGPRDGGGLWSFIAKTIFVLTIVFSLGVFGAEWYINRNLVSLNASLTAAREELAPERIQEINRAFDRLNAIGGLLAKHVSLSSFLDKLAAMTVKTLRFTDFSFDTLSEKGITLNLKVEAVGYVSVAEQAEVFNQQPFFKNPVFFDLDLNEQGAVLFSFKGNLDPSVISSNILTPPGATATQ